MIPLPRLHAVADAETAGRPDFAERCQALLAPGPTVALHLRERSGPIAALVPVVRSVGRLAPGAWLFAHGRAELAVIGRCAGLHLRLTDLPPGRLRDSYRPLWTGWIGVSVHSETEGRQAREEGADYLMVGNVFLTETHPGRPAAGLGLIRDTARLGLPVIAIGGITPENVAAVRAAGAYGIAAIRALWQSPDPAATTAALLAPYREAA